MIAVNTIKGGMSTMNDMLYGAPNQGLINYFAQNIQNASNVMQNMGQQFIDRTMEIFNNFNSDEAINRAKSLSFQANIIMDQNAIMAVYENNYGNMTYRMQQQIMSHPVVFNLWQDGRCYGFSDTIIDPTLGYDKVEETTNHIQYMDGLATEDDTCVFTTSDDSEDLHILDKVAIYETYNTVNNLIAQGIDPTTLDKEEL
jgi:hypothetical protein